MAQRSENGYLDLRFSCRPCCQEQHHHCREHPDKDGSFWVDEDDGTKRLAIFEGGIFGGEGRGREIPRPPCQCGQDSHRGNPGTCGVWMSHDWGGGARCGKPSKGVVRHKPMFGDEVEVEACGLHMGAAKRKANLAAKKAEEEAERERRREEIRNVSRASRDWAEKLSSEFGLPVKPIPADREKVIRVEMSPEQAYKVLSEVRSMLDDVYDEHPFRRGERDA